MPTKKKPFINIMCEVRDLERKEVVNELSMAADMNGGIRCPVPNCNCKTIFKRWGDMRGHFLDDSTHKKDYFRIFLEKMHEPFCDLNGAGFNHGVNSLMLALIRQPTSVEDFQNEGNNRKATTKTNEPVAPTRPKKARPVQEQQDFEYAREAPAEAAVAPPRARGASPSNFSRMETTEEEPAVEEVRFRRSGKSAFSQVSEYVRDSEEINKTWRGKVLEEYVDMFHGIPPCFHCRSEEGKQIHHQNPLFHEIVLISLNKLGTTAEKVIEERNKGNEQPLKNVLQDVFAYHMKPGRVCAVPYCQGCNQDAETKRKRGKRNGD
jgi:hypothetical protein